MSESKNVMRPLAGAAAALLGLSGQAWATYGGGACHRCAPAPVVATSCNVVALAPQCQTVMQTVYETVYENQPVHRHGDPLPARATGPRTTPSCGP